jgi:hypothetical protein
MGVTLEGLGWLGGFAVGGAALILNILLIRLTRRQLANADLEENRLRLEVEKIEVETLYIHKRIEGDSMIT